MLNAKSLCALNTLTKTVQTKKKNDLLLILRDHVIVEGWPQVEIIELSPANFVSLSLTCDTQMASSQPNPSHFPKEYSTFDHVFKNYKGKAQSASSKV